MQKINKTIFLITIVLVSLLCLTAASAASDDDDAIAGDFPAVDIVAAESDVSVAASEDAQTVDNAYDDLSYEADDVIANSSSDAQSSLGSSPLGDSNTKTFSQLADDISSNPAMLSGAYYKYDADVDSDYANGITLTNGLTIIGGGATIDGNNMARIFNIPEGVSVTIMNLNLINGVADEGAAIYNSGKLTLMSSKVNDNTAVKSGAGIYNNNNGEVLVTSCEFDGNDLTDRTHNGWGGAAIYSNQGTVTITDSNITNNLKNIVHRGGTGAYTGDLSSAAVTSEGGSLTVTNSYFKANSGSYGGAILANGGTLLVSGTTFEDNFAFNGGAIDIANADYTITNSKFIGNDAKGTGSGQTNYAHGGAIAAQDANNQGLISGCDFEGNTAAIGGAISTTNTVVTDSTFTNNNADAANSETYNGATNNRGGFGGAVYNDGTINIDGSEFTDNLGRGRGLDLKNAEISDSSFTNTIINVNNRGTVEVSNNQYDNDGKDISSTSGCAVMVNIEDGDVPYVTSGTIIYNGDMTFQDLQDIIDAGNTAITLGGNVVKSADEEITFADGLTINRSVTIYGNEKTITASTGKIFNVAEGKTLSLNGNTLVGSGETAIINHGTVSLGLASPNTFTNCGEAPIDNQGRTSQTGLTTFTQLSNLIALVNGGEIYIGSSKITKADGEDEIAIDKEITVTGYYSSYYKRIDTVINANNDGRVFNVAEGKTLTLNAINITNGAAEKGAGIYVSEGATLNANNVNFLNNVAEKRGGAIYSEGTVNVDAAVFDGNDITFRTKNDDNGGAAIYNLNGVLNVNNANITNNLKDIVIRNGNAGDLLVGVVVTSGETTIQNSYFANNTGSWGGAISSLGYLNDESYTLTVTGTTFEGNNATFGGAIFVESSNLVVDDCTFIENAGVGVGSSGTSNTQGGAIVVFPNGAKATITGSTFTANSANTGGAVSLAGVDHDSLIERCTFTDNTASDGGAVYLWTGGDAAVTVKDSTFSGNTAGWGNAISTDGALKLEGNTISSASADIGNWGGSIGSEVIAVILANDTYNWHMGDFVINATLTDDNGNMINDHLFNFVISKEGSEDILVPATFYTSLGYYQGTFTPANAGTYLIGIDYAESEVQTSLLKVSGSLTDLANLIANDEDGVIELGDDYSYIAEFDAGLENGIVIDKVVTINGNNYVINGSDTARLFNVVSPGKLTLTDVTIANGKAADGAGVYVESGAKLDATSTTFKDNVATYSGGAIYTEGGVISLTDSILDGNDVTDYTKNNDTGGAAIYANNSATVTLVNTNVTNNGNKELNRTKGDLVNAVINLIDSDLTVTDCVFENNTGIYGGAIATQAPSGEKTLAISTSNFTSNAAYTGGAVYVGPNVKFTIEDSIFDANNKATGEGSTGYTSGGGAIQILDAGEGTIDNVIIKNSQATQAGAIGIEGSAPVTIKDSTFENNVATSEGGAIYAATDAALTVTGSTFTDNDAPFGSAISNDGALTLSGNKFTGGSTVAIANYYGDIKSEVFVKILDGQTVTTTTASNEITAVLTDDNNNPIIDKTLVLIVNNEEVETAYNRVTGVMTGSYTFTAPGTYEVTAKDFDAEHTTSGTLVYTAGTYTELQNLIDAAEAGATITLDHDITYNEAFDGAAFLEGITVDKEITIVGAEGIKISGNDLARVFKVTDGATLTLNDVTICDGAAEKGAGVYVDAGATLNANDVTFIDNVAVKRGGAIYSEGTVNVDTAVFDKNDITFRSANDDNGGAAIYNNGGTLTVNNANITNNLLDIVIRDGNDGHLINAVVFTNGDATITDSYFANNTGSWGAGIYVTGDATLTVSNTTFEGNNATFGASIYDEGAKIIVDNCTFNDNNALGVGSPGTSSTQAGAILVMSSGASATITDSKFNRNTARTGGAVSISQADGDVVIEGCEFTENTASYEGGAIYNYAADGASLTVKDSTFTDNTANNWGDAISNDAALNLEGNTITGGRDAAIGNWLGTIDSKVISVILANDTYNWHMDAFVINATLTDDNGNLINDHFFNFVLSKEGAENILVPATFYTSLGYYQGVFTPADAGTYLIGIDYAESEVQTSVVEISRTLSDLANLIANDEDGRIELDGDYSYVAEFDAALKDGIVIDEVTTIIGNGFTICGEDSARIFYVNSRILNLENLTICHGAAEKGAGVYVDAGSIFVADGVTFTENVAVKRGGAIYSEGTVTIYNSSIDSNDVTFRSANDDNGGAAIYNLGGTLSLDNVNVTNNLKDIVIRDGNDGHLINGAVVSTGTTIIDNSYFANNTGSWGGAIYLPSSGTLDVSNTVFEGNNATFGAAIYDEGGAIVVDNCTFNDNAAVGIGSAGTSNTQGGAILVMSSGVADIKNSRFNRNSAKVGGAVSFAGSKDSAVTNCNFTDNTAEDGGAIYLWTQGDAAVTVKDSTFSGNTAGWGNAISTDGALKLEGNTISTTSADIGNYFGSIESKVIVQILGNDTTEGAGIVEATFGETVPIYAVITDDNGNLIKDISLVFTISSNAGTKSVEATYNDDTNKYEAEYDIESAGKNLVSITSSADEFLVINTGLIDVAKVDVTLTINVEDIYEGQKAVVTGQIIGIDDTGIAADIIVVVNDVDYNVTTTVEENGTFSFEIPDLTAGSYGSFAIFLGDNNYNYEYASDLFEVKERQLAVVITNLDDLQNFVYGDQVTLEFTVTDAITGEAVTGADILITNYDDADISYDDEEGNYQVNLGMLKPGDYELSAFFKVEGYEPLTYEPINVKVSKADIDVIVNRINDTITYGQDETIFVGTNNTAFEGTISITLINYYNGTEIVSFNVTLDPEDDVVQELGGLLVDISDLNAGKYNITAKFEGNDGYNADEVTIQEPYNTFEVKKAGTILIIEVPSVNAGDDIPISVSLYDEFNNPISGDVYLEVPGIETPLVVEVVNGEGDLNVTNTLVRNTDYEVTAEFRSTTNYEASDDSDKFDVIGLHTGIIIEPVEDISYGTNC